MTSTELVPFDARFARFQTSGLPVLSLPIYQHHLVSFDDIGHDVNWRFYEPSLDDLEGLDYWDEARRQDPSLVDNKNFLDGFEADHLAETGHLPRAQWYRDARQRQRLAARATRQRRLTKAWAASLDGGSFTMDDHDQSVTSGTETFESHSVFKVRYSGKGPLAVYDSHGHVVPRDGLVFDRQTTERYRDRSVAETAIFHPVKGDGLTLDEMLSDMSRFERTTPDEWEPLPEATPVDTRYGKSDRVTERVRHLKQVVELTELKARAVEICRYPWNDDQAKRDSTRARGWIRRSRLLEWGTDTWQVIVTRKLHVHGDPMDLDDPAHTNMWTVFVRTHTGSETVRRAGRPDLQVWTWEPHYYRTFTDEESATVWLERLEDAFLRERHGDLDAERWPNDLLADRSVAASQAAAQWKLWQARQRDGWKVTNLDKAPGQVDFMPHEPSPFDPYLLQQTADGEAPVPEPVQ